MDIRNIKKLIETSNQETLKELNILIFQSDNKIDKEKEKVIKNIKDLEKRIKDF